MYILSAVVEKERTAVALYDKEYKLLLKKDGTFASLTDICKKVISERGINPDDVDYAGVAADSSLGSSLSLSAELEKNIERSENEDTKK